MGVDPIFPPGFKPDKVDENVVENNGDSIQQPNINLHSNFDGISSVKSGSRRVLKIKPGGSILEVTEDLIEGQISQPGSCDIDETPCAN
ncbi:hypothetical protein Tco_0988569 [Tanacetum coccineum]|uniref:Uncharacterized protein n=1 Tax=Tanacetum coccineum TaxID=301880 RepID=A0ABQ5ERB5_9ASTR